MSQSTVVNLDELLFDPDNPRIPLNMLDSSDESKVIEYMVRNGNIIELMESIGETGFSVAEPLLVVPFGKKYIVVEGNRRLTALKLLSNPDLSTLRKKSIADAVQKSKKKPFPTNIPVIIYPSRSDILDYLGYRHITGVKDWGALEKARYLDQLYSRHIESVGQEQIYSVLARMIGSRADYVAKLHISLKLYDIANDEAYFGVDIQEQDIDFSLLYTAIGYTSTRKYIELETINIPSLNNFNKDNFDSLFCWLFDPKKKKISDSRQLSELSKILESPEATEKLKLGSSISEALVFTSAPNDTFQELITLAKVNLQSAKNIIEQLNSYPNEALQLISDIEKLCKSIKGALSENYPDDGLTLDSHELKKKFMEFLESQKQGD